MKSMKSKTEKLKIIIFISLGFGCLLCGIFIYKVIKVNREYPQAPSKYITFGDTYDMEPDISVTVNKTTWMTNQEYVKEFGEDVDIKKEQDARIVYTDITLKNNSQEEKPVDFYKFYIEKTGYYNGLALDIFLNLPNTEKASVKLKAGEECQTTLVYVLYDYQFPKEVWENIENENFYLVNSRYPIRICWNITE